MTIDGPGQLLLLAAGAVAGVIGTAGGITSLVSYPALLAVGLTPFSANLANIVALVACWPGSALASRRELKGGSSILSTTLPIAAVGGGAGSLLLLLTPPGVFSHVVPWLVLAGSAALVVQPALMARRTRGRRPGLGWLFAWVALLSVYGGYFGAGAGIMLLAVLLWYDPRVPHANALKNMLAGAAVVASAVLFVATQTIVWSAVVPLAVGLLVGSLVGPGVARRLPAAAVRWGAAALGVALAVDLWINPG